MSKNITVYRLNQSTGEVDKINAAYLNRVDNAALNYHERILKTYYDLECKGEIPDRINKQKVKDIHVMAQNPAYWDSPDYPEERGTLGYARK